MTDEKNKLIEMEEQIEMLTLLNYKKQDKSYIRYAI